MTTRFEIMDLKKIEGFKYQATIVLKSAVCPESEFPIQFFCRDENKIRESIGEKLIEFADEIRAAANSP